jgi:glutamate-5-semialdehyde dehydrogenase
MAPCGCSYQKQSLLKVLARRCAKPAALEAANQKDLARATAAGLSAPMVDRLKLTPKIIETVALGCEQLAAMADVIGEIIGMKQQPSGIRVGQMRVPIGVFGMIYESRPNVTIEAASLAIKSGNACILRGGSEAIESNKALALLVPGAGRRRPAARRGAAGADHRPRSRRPADCHARVRRRDHPARRQGPDRAHQPRRQGAGHQAPGRQLPRVRRRPCEFDMALRIVADNAKTQKYSPCNASEGLLVARGVAEDFLPRSAPSSRPRAWRCAATRWRWPSCAPR